MGSRKREKDEMRNEEASAASAGWGPHRNLHLFKIIVCSGKYDLHSHPPNSAQRKYLVRNMLGVDAYKTE